MFSLDLNPVILNVGSFQISYYLLALVFGFLAALFVLLKSSKEKKIKLSEEEIYDLIALLILGTIIGARLFHVVFWGSNYYLQNPIKIFYIWEGGLSFHGGFLGAFIVILTYSKIKKISFLKIADILVVPAVFFLALGRVANFFNAEILGKISDISWCVVFQGIEGCRHPIQLYAAAGRFALFFTLIFIQKKFKQRKNGLLFWTFILLISVGRFASDFLRDEQSFCGLLPGQWFSIVLVIISIYAFKRLHLLKSPQPCSIEKTFNNSKSKCMIARKYRNPGRFGAAV